MITKTSIRSARAQDKAALLDLAVATGLFRSDELAEFDTMVSEYFAGDLGDNHFWIVDADPSVLAAAYYAPEAMADRVWNLYFIGVHPGSQGVGRGGQLLRHVEDHLRKRGERLLIVETSGLESFDATRSFYRRHGYDEEARIRDFYVKGDDKVTFRKQL